MQDNKTVSNTKLSDCTQIRQKTNSSQSRRISCKDLGHGDCEGWLWIKKHSIFRDKFVRRWCILKDNCFYFYIHTDNEKAEGLIHVQDFKVSPIENFKSNNFYFKIHNEDISFTFGSDTQRDFTKWLNKLQLSANNVDIDHCDGSVGGFTPEYIRSSSNTLRSNVTISDQSNDLSMIRKSRVMSRYSESDDSDVDSDKVSEETTNTDTNEEQKRNPTKLRTALSAAERISDSNRSTGELNALTMEAIKRIVEIERLIRNKKLMLSKIDQFLKLPTTSESIREFWDDYNEEIIGDSSITMT